MPCGICEKNGRFAKCLKATDNSPGSFIWNRVFQLLGANIRNCSKYIQLYTCCWLYTRMALKSRMLRSLSDFSPLSINA